METMANRIFWLVYSRDLGEAVVLALTACLLWSYGGHRWERRPFWRVGNAVGAVCILWAIVYGTLLHRVPGTRELILEPLHFLTAARLQPEVYRSTLMNVILFMPFGLAVPYILPLKWGRSAKICLVVLAGLVLSAVVEWCQYRFALGRCEVDDVIMNTLGTLLGAAGYGGFRCRKE